MWVVDIGVPFSDEYRAYDLASEFEDCVRMADSAGGGFGYRDLQFETDSYVEGKVIEVAFQQFVLDHPELQGTEYYCELGQWVRLP